VEQLDYTDVRQVLRTYGTVRTCKKNAFLFHVNDPVNDVYYLDEGWVKVSQDGGEGQGVTLFLRQAGELFATAEVLTRMPRRERYARCLTDCRIYALGARRLFELMDAHPELLLTVASMMSRRLLDTQNFVEALMNKPVSWRLAHVLVKLAGPGGNVSLPITHEEISFLIGCSRQTVTDLLNRWHGQGYIAYRRRSITILDEDALFDR